jgi:ubiquinone/menaquinone biosynthesis C-methylase UbiE
MTRSTTLKTRASDGVYQLFVVGVLMRLQKLLYPLVTRLTTGDESELLLLNNGYEEDPPMALPLAASEEPSRFQIQMYHRVATQVDQDFNGRRVLEVGCGHGGGASYITRILGPTSYTGMDLNPAAIAFSQRRHNVPGLDFVRGDAENLPFPDESFDAVINIESSHCYPGFSRFLAEVARVLRPGGHFLYSDGPHPMGIVAWQDALANAPMRMISETRINEEMARGLEKNLPHIQEAADAHTPAFLHRVIHKVVGSMVLANCRVLENDPDSYWMYSFVKA